MRNINNMFELENEISVLRQRQRLDLAALKYQYDLTVNNLKPANLVKNALHDVISAPDLKSNMVKAAIGFGTTYLSKKLYDANSINPVKQALTHAIKFGISYFSKSKARNFIS